MSHSPEPEPEPGPEPVVRPIRQGEAHVSDQDETERKRRERASLATAFDRRAWQRGEKPKVRTRLLAGGVSLVVAAAAVFGVGALISYQQGRADKERKEKAALKNQLTTPSTKPSPTSAPPSSPRGTSTQQPGGTSAQAPADAPRRESPSADPKPQARTQRGYMLRHRFPLGPKFQTTTRVLIKNQVTGLCMDVPGYGKGREDGPVEQYGCTPSTRDNQLWDLVVNQPGTARNAPDLFTIRNSKDGFCLDLYGYRKPEAGRQVSEYYCRPGPRDNQMWYLQKVAFGRFLIRNHKSGLCLGVVGARGSGGPGARLLVNHCSLTDDYIWSFDD